MQEFSQCIKAFAWTYDSKKHFQTWHYKQNLWEIFVYKMICGIKCLSEKPENSHLLETLLWESVYISIYRLWVADSLKGLD